MECESKLYNWKNQEAECLEKQDRDAAGDLERRTRWSRICALKPDGNQFIIYFHNLCLCLFSIILLTRNSNTVLFEGEIITILFWFSS